ncbi:Aste57867_16655 [Aphanomyces stellatus]|uniref:Aste57867_16655 protein n=1 Tax=Aphanomyces stellatus TaxID=120398 RepID=A0A485L6T1_9STRA|nr:hypothetical protein As57867_016598 [Aphanomyces stellatus]VFT93426.1 Aste57867_16655 [Aphanomyces stellatus]
MILLHEIIALPPFMARRGTIMEAWEKIATKVQCKNGFDRTNFCGKKAHSRFTIMLAGHRQWKEGGGVIPEDMKHETEKVVLLQKLLELYDESKKEDESLDDHLAHARELSDYSKEDARVGDADVTEDDDEPGAAEEAGNAEEVPPSSTILGKRKATDNGQVLETKISGSSGNNGGALLKFMSMIFEQNREELAFRRHQYEQDLEERRKERLQQLELARMDHEQVMTMLKALTDNRR